MIRVDNPQHMGQVTQIMKILADARAGAWAGAVAG